MCCEMILFGLIAPPAVIFGARIVWCFDNCLVLVHGGRNIARKARIPLTTPEFGSEGELFIIVQCVDVVCVCVYILCHRFFTKKHWRK